MSSRPRIIWKSAGLHLTERLDNGWLAIGDDLLRAWFARPELALVDESGPKERALVDRLFDDPRAAVSDDDLKAIAGEDGDVADNWRFMIAFRDRLLASGSIEAAYRDLFKAGSINVPPVFLDQLLHLIVSNMLAGEADPFVARAGELLFREQIVTTENGQLIAADKEIVEQKRETGGFGGLGALLREAGTPTRQVEIDVMTETNAQQYWERADRFDFALDLRYTEAGLDAFARVLARFVAHMHSLPVRVNARQSIKDERWSWHIGLDRRASELLDTLYGGGDAEAVPDQIVGLFRMEVLQPERLIPTMAGKPIYLAMALGTDGSWTAKPQNLIVNMPFARSQ